MRSLRRAERGVLWRRGGSGDALCAQRRAGDRLSGVRLRRPRPAAQHRELVERPDGLEHSGGRPALRASGPVRAGDPLRPPRLGAVGSDPGRPDAGGSRGRCAGGDGRGRRAASGPDGQLRRGAVAGPFGGHPASARRRPDRVLADRARRCHDFSRVRGFSRAGGRRDDGLAWAAARALRPAVGSRSCPHRTLQAVHPDGSDPATGRAAAAHVAHERHHRSAPACSGADARHPPARPDAGLGGCRARVHRSHSRR